MAGLELAVKTRILIVDDHVEFRQDLARYLAMLDGNYEVIDEVSTAESALARIDALAPDIVLMDLELPGCSGLTATQRICHTWPSIKVIVISNNPAVDYRELALDAGAVDYVDKLELFDALPPRLAAAARLPRQ